MAASRAARRRSPPGAPARPAPRLWRRWSVGPAGRYSFKERSRMAFRIPRPGKSGREFAREVAIVILGVLIALALEQVAASWRDRARAADIRTSMDEELSDFITVFDIRAI